MRLIASNQLIGAGNKPTASSKKQVNITNQLPTATASSAAVERTFSSFGLVPPILRSRLGNERTGKLVILVKLMNKNKKPANEEEHFYRD
jgi:hypothetical protein